MFQILATFSLLLLGHFIGQFNEKRHYKSIWQRERRYKDLPVVSFQKNLPENSLVVQQELFYGSTVVSVDYFKKFLAALKMLFGGQLYSYESLLDRARREAILDLKTKAKGFDMVLNLKIETCSIGQGQNIRGALGSVEVLAYGTAIKVKNEVRL